MNQEKQISELAIGDKVFYGDNRKWETTFVKRITNTQIVIDIPNYNGQMFEHRFYKKNGYKVGTTDSYYTQYLKVWTEEMQANVDQQNRYRAVFRLLPQIRENDHEKINRAYEFLKAENLIAS